VTTREKVARDDLRVAIAARLSWFAPTYTMSACVIEADAIIALVKEATPCPK
jgi:hypothetical protein